ncbi:hypothetical protein [Streptomyces sp. Y7]|uniref:hypothetical protein n=1 Tax=Streptomyces sp. Y7 TaxID=3342392 RepID=UPI00371508AB
MSTSTSAKDATATAKDAITSVITLSSGILAISLTFSKRDWVLVEDKANKVEKPLVTDADLQYLQISWILFLGAIFCGVWAMLAISGIIFSGTKNINDWSLRIPWLLQLGLFISGLVIFVMFGYRVT